MTEPERVQIHYLRPPDRHSLFIQPLIHRDPTCIVTFMPHTPLARPVRVNGETVLEDGSPVIWFTYPGRMHDVGSFHDARGRFTGWYANVLTPVHFHSPLEWETTDLFLDVWLGTDGAAVLLDRDELDAALASGVIDAAQARAAVAEAERLLAAAARGDFPPAEARAWPLHRVHAVLGTDGAPTG